MSEGHHWLLPGGRRLFWNAAVPTELGRGEAAGRWLYRRPFDAEAVAVKPETRRNLEILPPAIVTVAGVARRFAVTGRLDILADPGVRIDVVALALMGRDRRAPEETLRDRHGVGTVHVITSQVVAEAMD